MTTALPKPEWKTCTETSATISVAAPAGAVIEYKEYPEVRAARTRQHLFTRARLAGVVGGADRRRRGRRGDDPESQPGVDLQLSPRGGRRQGPGARRRHARCARAARPRARTRRAPSQRRTARRSRGAASYSERSPSSSSSQGRPRLAFGRPYARLTTSPREPTSARRASLACNRKIETHAFNARRASGWSRRAARPWTSTWPWPGPRGPGARAWR